MFAIMKSRRPHFEPPCNYQTCSCYCHQPESPEYQARKKADDWSDFKLTISVLAFVIIMLGGLFWFISSRQPIVQHIQVNGTDCIVQTITDNCTSTGSCETHDIAVCPK